MLAIVCSLSFLPLIVGAFDCCSSSSFVRCLESLIVKNEVWYGDVDFY